LREIDELDRKILRLLQKDASLSYEAMGNQVGTSVGTVYNRIKRMKEEKVIRRIVPELDSRMLGFGICSLIELSIEGGHMAEVHGELREKPCICSVFDVTGEYDTTLVAKFRTIDELNTFVKQLASHPHVLRTNTRLALNVIKESLTPEI